MPNLQFEHSISQFDIEKLKLLFVKVINGMQQRTAPNTHSESPLEPTVNVQYCPKCTEKLHTTSFKMKSGEIICDYCNNASICKLYEILKGLNNIMEGFMFDCPNFIPKMELLNGPNSKK